MKFYGLALVALVAAAPTELAQEENKPNLIQRMFSPITNVVTNIKEGFEFKKVCDKNSIGKPCDKANDYAKEARKLKKELFKKLLDNEYAKIRATKFEQCYWGSIMAAHIGDKTAQVIADIRAEVSPNKVQYAEFIAKGIEFTKTHDSKPKKERKVDGKEIKTVKKDHDVAKDFCLEEAMNYTPDAETNQTFQEEKVVAKD